jgi:hypothetical protein|tara:strand:- start:699 stop:953 length:255 start_codon:yes stop_codon:yes gene_type:complete
MNQDYERGFSAGYRAALSTAERDISVDIGDSRPTKVKPVKRKMKKSNWHKYMKNKKNQIKFKRGAKKGLLDMKTMSRNYRRSRK